MRTQPDKDLCLWRDSSVLTHSDPPSPLQAWPWNNDHSATVFEGHPNSPSWLYDWELYKVGNVDATSLEYVSMARTKDAGPNVSPFMADTGSKRLLCLNEPDMDEQADL